MLACWGLCGELSLLSFPSKTDELHGACLRIPFAPLLMHWRGFGRCCAGERGEACAAAPSQ